MSSSPVPAVEASEWCARMVVAAKNGQVRCTVDFQVLDSFCRMETLSREFHQLSLDVEIRQLTTSLMSWSSFGYKGPPWDGHCSILDTYTRRFEDDIQDIISPNYKCVEYTLLYGGGGGDTF